MKALLIIGSIASMLMFTTGCGARGVRRGDFSREFIRLTRECGARLAATNGIPPLQASWATKKDTNGFECVVRNTDYDSVEDVIFRILGNSGQRLQRGGDVLLRGCIFKAADVGVALIAMDKTNHIQINCVRGTTNRFPFSEQFNTEADGH
jgi:hypothetical protein